MEVGTTHIHLTHEKAKSQGKGLSEGLTLLSSAQALYFSGKRNGEGSKLQALQSKPLSLVAGPEKSPVQLPGESDGEQSKTAGYGFLSQSHRAGARTRCTLCLCPGTPGSRRQGCLVGRRAVGTRPGPRSSQEAHPSHQPFSALTHLAAPSSARLPCRPVAGGGKGGEGGKAASQEEVSRLAGVQPHPEGRAWPGSHRA